MKKEKIFFKESYIQSWSYIKESKDFIYLSVFFFFAFFLIGFFLPTPKILEQKILEIIQELLKVTEGSSWLQLTRFIFLNNLQSSFFGMTFGIFFGFYSMVVLIINGYLLGFVALKATHAQGISILWKIFPHGIFELPALFLSTGFGVKIGFFVFKKNKFQYLKENLTKSFKTFFLVVIPLLIIAAFTEATLIFYPDKS